MGSEMCIRDRAEALLPALMILVLGLVASMALVPSLDQASSKG